ncbi:MAG TPA: cysteine--tRNA ligase [Gammaproteobacteria bacterium]|nr:cysteine--tRNA ligase [Gammaproteobacteria bacterium]
MAEKQLRSIQIYNNLTRQKEEFTPLCRGKIRMYVCGMTVYDYCHLGHARVLVSFDFMVRFMRACGYDVTYVRNITDVDDKIIQRANEQNRTIQSLTDEFIQAMHEDEKKLNVLPPDIEPRATESMADIIQMIEVLQKKGFAYSAENGDIYYEVGRFESYGKLSHKQVTDLRAGARVQLNQAKKDPLDFVLWKSAKVDEPSWSSPWGPGRPGWHIECSAMSTRCLGDSFDIHGGGLDLQFPHHENEIAQSEAATDKPFAHTWIHVGFVQVNQEKMSKSLGNFFTIREVLKEYHPEVIRYLMIASHYRSPLNYSTEQLDNAKAALDRFYSLLRTVTATEAAEKEDYSERFYHAMADDFNTPEALAVLFDLVREINRLKSLDEVAASRLCATLIQLSDVLGILQADPETFLKQSRSEDNGWSDERIEALIKERQQARTEKDWARADEIRDQLAEAGVLLEDSGASTSWRRS